MPADVKKCLAVLSKHALAATMYKKTAHNRNFLIKKYLRTKKNVFEIHCNDTGIKRVKPTWTCPSNNQERKVDADHSYNAEYYLFEQVFQS